MTTNRKTEWLCLLFILPAVLVRGFTSLYPIAQAFVDSLYDYNRTYQTHDFIGLGNFARMLTDANIKESIGFTVFFTVTTIVLHTVLGIALALLLNQAFSGRKLLRTVALIPWAMPLIAVGIAASWGFNDMYGFVNDLIRRFIYSEFHYDWLAKETGARLAVIITDVWKGTPFYAILILPGLQNISADTLEAAKIDGAGVFRRFFRITLPCIMPLVVTMTIFFTLWRITSFDIVYIMTQGGPGTATALMSYRIYMEAFRNMDYGYASAISVVLCLIMIVFALVGLAAKRKVDYEQ